jgi:hypothetical protein
MVRKLSPFAAATLCSLGLTLFPSAGDANDFLSNDVDNYLPVCVSLRDEAIICDEQVRRIYVTVNTNTLAFVLPQNCRLDASNPKRIVLTEANHRCFLVVRILAPRKLDSKNSPTPSFRDMVLAEHPGATIVDEFFRSGAGRSGPAFDLQSTNSSQLVQCVRVVFLSSPVGTVELALQCQGAEFNNTKHLLDSLLRSFCTDENGPIKALQSPTEPPRS